MLHMLDKLIYKNLFLIIILNPHPLSSTNHHRCATKIKNWINIFFIDMFSIHKC